MDAVIYYVNPTSSGPVHDAITAGWLGAITTPIQGNAVREGWDVIADNGCFSDRWTPESWRRWILTRPYSVRFAVTPDVYDAGGAPTHAETLDRWHTYAPFLTDNGLTPAFVAQIGATPATIPDDAEVIFLGGTTAWKLGNEARAITADAKRRGRWVHMGRVNSWRRLTIARDMGCDSADGTLLAHGPDVNLYGRALPWAQRMEAEPMLWEAVAAEGQP